MNQAHLHLLVNHIPIIFPIIGTLVLIGGLIFKSKAVKNTAFVIFAMGALATIAASSTGEGAEEVVEKIQGIDENFIKIHEEASEIFSILSYILGAFSLLALWAIFKEKSFSAILNYILVVFAVIVIFFASRTGTTGGEIRHTEIRSSTSNNPTLDNTTPAENQDADKDDD